MIDNNLFRNVTIQVCGTLDLSQAFKNVFKVLHPFLPLDELRINILDTDVHVVKTVCIVNNNGAQNLLYNPIVIHLPEDVESELRGRRLEDIRIVGSIEEDRATSSVRSEYFNDVPDSSMLIMRLILEEKRQGVLLLRAEGKNRYKEKHKQLLSGLNEPLAIALNNALAHYNIEQLKNTLSEENRDLQRELGSNIQEIIGSSFGLSSVMKLVFDVAQLDSTVLLLGETGVGKEVIAKAIHHTSSRRNKPFIKLNCGAIPKTLIDSELFGHEKGAFTGAISQKKGRFERAHEGTLFLDEIAELPLEAQVTLLRVLQTGEFERVGGDNSIRSDVRIIAATHRNLSQMVTNGSFREDLWYRINVFPINIPPLRERRVDIPALVHHFIETKSNKLGIYPRPRLHDNAMEILKNHRWPGNVRELENAVEREIIINRDRSLSFDWLTERQADSAIEEGIEPRPKNDDGTSEDLRMKPEPLEAIIEKHIRNVLTYTNGNVGGKNGAAEILGMNPSTLRHKMRKLGIPFGRGHAGE